MNVHTGESAFDLPSWRDLLERDPNRNVFATPEWNRLWWEEFGEGKQLLVLELGDGADVTAIVPLYAKREGKREVLRFVGGIDLTDYLGPICKKDDLDAAAVMLVRWLSTSEISWDEFDAHNMPVPFGFADLLVDRADREGLEFRLEQEETSAVLALPSSWDDYLGSLRSKERHELRRKRRRLQREHPEMAVRKATDETLDRDLKVFFEMHRGAEGHKGHFLRPEIATFFERIAAAFAPEGRLSLDLLEIGGETIASTFSFIHGHTFYLYNSAYEAEWSRLSPGFVLVSELVHRAIDEGVKVFDFLRGPERYKYQLGASAVPLNNVRILR